MKILISIIAFLVVWQAAEAQPTKGRVRVVSSFPTYKIKQVDHNEDFKIRIVNHSPFNDYEWEYVDGFEDFSIQFVDAFEDYRVRFEYDTPRNKAQRQSEPKNDSQESYIIAVVGSAPRILDTPYIYTPPVKSEHRLWFERLDSIERAKKWQQDSIRKHRQDSIRQRDSILHKIFWPDDF